MASKFSKSYFLDTITQALRQGITPRKLALTCAFGVVIGIFPVIGTTTLICLGISILFKLNIVVIQLVNYLLTPLQIILIVPLIKTGTYLFGLKTFSYSSDQLSIMFKNNFWNLIRESGVAIAGGVGIWLFISIPLFLISFYLSLFILNRLVKPDRAEPEQEVMK